jgi:hypothetical protein
VSLTATECKAIQKGLFSMKYTDLPSAPAREMYFTHKGANCAVRTPEIVPSQRPCLSTFKNAAEYARCAPPPTTGSAGAEPPESEFGDAKK